VLAVALALASCIATGATDFLAGFKSRQLGVLTVIVVSQASSLILFALVAAIVGVESPNREFLLYVAASGIGSLSAVIAFWRGLVVGAMGVVAPITATGALIPIAAGLASGERPSSLQAIGIALAFVGVVSVSYAPDRSGARGSRAAAGVGLALLAAIGIGVFYVAIDAASEQGSAFSAAFANRVFTVGLLLAPAILLRSRLSLPPNDAPAVVGVGVLEITAILLFAAASTEGLLSVVGAITALYPVTTVLLARFVLHERLHPVQRAGSVAAIAGIAAVTAGVAP
jgi:drug/metabolite transporter (DMT)-like permease